MRVAYQAGVLRALAEEQLCFHHADGTSGGTINLAMLLSGLSPTEMCERWRTLDPKNFMSLMPLEDYLRVGDLPALASADGIISRVFPHLGIDVSAVNQAVGLEGTFNLCNFSRKLLETIAHTSLTRGLLVAGISLPILMPAVTQGGAFYTDGVWIKDANLMGAVEHGAQEIWVVWCIANTPTYHNGLIRQYVHMIEMSANGALFGELAQIREINDRIERGDRIGGRTEPIVVHLVKPPSPLPLDPDYFMGKIDGASLVQLGYEDAQLYLRERTPKGLPLTPNITRVPDETQESLPERGPQIAPDRLNLLKVSAYGLFYGYVLTLILAGLWGVFFARIDQNILFHLNPPELEKGTAASLISQYRFLRAIEFGFGMFSIIFRNDIFSSSRFNRLFLGTMFIGLAARGVSLVLDGVPYPIFDCFAAYELVSLILIYMYSRTTVTR
jgi:hypothetical protein